MWYYPFCYGPYARKYYGSCNAEPARVSDGLCTHPIALRLNLGLDIRKVFSLPGISQNGADITQTLCGPSLHCTYTDELDMEYPEKPMIQTLPFEYPPGEHEAERASNSYLMSLVAVIAGLPLPIINVIATGIFYFGNRRSTYFVRWHCTQAFLSQLSMLFINSYGFWWTVAIVLGPDTLSSKYIAYILTAIVFNLLEFVATLYTAIQTRKGHHVVWWLYGDITNLICKTEPS
jgi:uncharacterized membrane protein